jgi:AcrR family transcriptional regulator
MPLSLPAARHAADGPERGLLPVSCSGLFAPNRFPAPTCAPPATDAASGLAEEDESDLAKAQIQVRGQAEVQTKTRVMATAGARGRRSQAERNAQTQAKLLAATIDCLHELGYSQTTIGLVTTRAGVSRGALSHHYPSKVELMVAVVEWVFEDDVRRYNRAMVESSFRKAFDDLIQTMWSILSRPAAIAVTEIMLAARSDMALAQRLRAKQIDIDREATDRVIDAYDQAGIAVRPDSAVVHKVIVAALRGLALEATFMRQDSQLKDALVLLAQMHASLYPELSKATAAPKD